ncbi:hypothetical protein Ccar_00015 [Clostridium carboxidivorans P7]|uniref:Uncharacterized protein n=4 Tax=Clostridium TaxID=1485 RepID=C6Q1S4_9CLOT|nr:hypothetical protein Ccar_00015 [Clostridium carboxidivorans P7]EET84567.1 conserved hypothetical protein [Clostridium carboxidivorans P7]EFG89790.1 hypothetical protein CLCAR_0956 [Clostridium carboxidivorans P7]
MLFAIISYLVRKLPIHFGVHTIIIILIYIMVNVLINKIPIDKAISSVLSGVIVLLICEWINLFILNDYLKVNIQVMEDNPMMRTLYMMPSLILFVCFISLLYLWLKIKKRNKDVFN